MVKRYYIQDYYEDFRGNTEKGKQPRVSSRLQSRVVKNTHQTCGEGRWLVGTTKNYMEAFDIFPHAL